jgi:hypothetical protein
VAHLATAIVANVNFLDFFNIYNKQINMKLIKSIYNRFLKLFMSKSLTNKKTSSTVEKTPEVTPVKKHRGRPKKSK